MEVMLWQVAFKTKDLKVITEVLMIFFFKQRHRLQNTDKGILAQMVENLSSQWSVSWVVPVMTSSIFVQLLLPCAESRLNSIIGLKTDKMVLKWKMGRDYWQMNKDLYRTNTQEYSGSFFFFFLIIPCLKSSGNHEFPFPSCSTSISELDCNIK